MKKFFAVALLTLLVLPVMPSSAQELHVSVPLQRHDAAPQRKCYTPDEAEAEQGIRIHSELMVIGLNCQHMTPRGWKNFYQQYREITTRNSTLFSGYESTLINFFAQSGERNPEGRLHDMRTNMANKVSTDAARMRPDVFCATYAPRLPKAAQMSREQLRQWAASTSGNPAVSRPRCTR